MSERYSPLRSCLSIWFIVAIYVWFVSSDLENRRRSSDIQIDIHCCMTLQAVQDIVKVIVLICCSLFLSLSLRITVLLCTLLSKSALFVCFYTSCIFYLPVRHLWTPSSMAVDPRRTRPHQQSTVQDAPGHPLLALLTIDLVKNLVSVHLMKGYNLIRFVSSSEHKHLYI